MVPPSVKVFDQTLINDAKPFFIYHLEVNFLGAKHVIFRQFPQFVQLQKKLLEHRDVTATKDERITLEGCLPKLNTGGLFSYFENVEAQAKRETESIETSGTELIKLVISGLFDIKEKPIKRILAFFELEECVKKRHRQRPENENLIVNCNILNLPQNLIANIFSYLVRTDLVSLTYTCKDLSHIAMSPFLWKHISLKARSSIVDDGFVENLTKKYTQITSLDLSYCDELSGNAAFAISQNCNPLYLRELNLDGCRKINDQAMKHLALKFIQKVPEKEEEKNEEVVELEIELPAATETPSDSHKDIDSIQTVLSIEKKISLPSEDRKPYQRLFKAHTYTYDVVQDEKTLKGGARGLTKITLSECKQITDRGVYAISKFTTLKSVSLLSCHHVTDKGVCGLLSKCKEIEELNLGGTQITMKTFDYILDNCPTLKRISVQGCNGISEADVKKLEERGIDAEYGEGSCRFYLLSEKETELPTVSTNSFKGRTTLSIHRLNNFVKDKLKSAGKEVTEVELLFEKKVLEDHITLQDLQAFKSKKEDVVITYRKKRSCHKKSFASGQPRPWTCKKDVCDCSNPDCKQTFDIFHQKLNCYSCGGVFCDKCTQYQTPIKRFGYDDPMRVCLHCWLAYKERS